RAATTCGKEDRPHETQTPRSHPGLLLRRATGSVGPRGPAPTGAPSRGTDNARGALFDSSLADRHREHQVYCAHPPTCVPEGLPTGEDATTMRAGATTMRAGATTMRAGATTMRAGTTTMRAGATTMRAGATTMRAGATTMRAGATTMRAGATAQREGATAQRE